MLAFPAAIKIHVAVEPVDMRKQYDGLWAAAQQQLHEEDPKNGALFCFVNRERTRLKLLYWEGTGVLADPQLAVFDGGTPIASNNDWSSSLSPTFTTLGAFALNSGSKDAALVVTLQAGKPYSVQVSGVGTTTGEALVEIYLMP